MSVVPFQKDVQPELGRTPVSDQLYKRACKLMPGGVNSPVRAFTGVGGTPLFIAGAQGAILQDMDGHQYIDYVGSWGPMILGHANPRVIEAIVDTAGLGTSFGAPTDRETYLADLLLSRHKGVDMVRLVNSGTEATMSAIRLARGYTDKKRIIKFEGCYHGHADSLLVAAGSGAATGGIPGSAGVPEEIASLTTVVPYNDIEALSQAFAAHDDIAAVIIEPVAGNMGCVPPLDGYLRDVQELCINNQALLIFDEVMTGLRVGKSSAMGLFNIQPDLVCFGKVIGGGLPLAAYGGRREIMEKLAPLGPVYQAGTLSGNPLATAAGAAMLEQLDDSVYAHLEHIGTYLQNGLEALLKKHKATAVTTRVGGMFGLFFADAVPHNMADVRNTDIQKYSKFFHGMLEQGIYLPPSAFEAWFLSTAHTEELIDMTLKAADTVLENLK